ncbi:MAG: glycosyltransferase family 39 protein [Aquificaceae bacterium]|nr:glycosyltransferase family 39 protein [Aquificaceae bacterium]
MFYRNIYLVVALSFIYFLLGNWLLSFTSIDEGRNMDAVQNMIRSQDFISPVYNCNPRFEKPPMLYWLVALSSYILGLGEFSARLVSGLSAIGLLVLTYLLGKEFFSREVVMKSLFILMTFPHLWIESRAVVPEMLNTFFTMAGLYAFLRERFNLGWLLFAFAFLTKGPVGVVLGVGVYLLWRRKLDFLKPSGLVLFLVVGFSWYVAMIIQHGYEYFYRFFIYENVMRYTGHRSTHPAPFYYYLIVLAIGTVWYLPLYPRLIRQFNRAWLPLLLWVCFVLLFFSLASNKLHHYILFAYPPLALLLSHVVSDRYLRFTTVISLLALFLLMPLLYFYESQRFTPKAYPVVKEYSSSVYFYKAEDSALVFYSGKCIEKIENPSMAEGLVITKEGEMKNFPNCKLLLKGKEFDGAYVLLNCG